MESNEKSLSLIPAEPGSRQTGQLAWIPLECIEAHPANANRMSEELIEKLATNIQREGDYEPVVVRPHPRRANTYQLLNGAHRVIVAERLGHDAVLCYIWPCDDETALVLLATLNRLEGQDDPLKRSGLLRELTALLPPDELSQLLPENASELRRSLALLDLDLSPVLADLERQIGDDTKLRAITFEVTPDDEAVIEATVRTLIQTLNGTNRRGRAFAQIIRAYDAGVSP